MPAVRKRGCKWNVQVRRSGFPSMSKTFDLKDDAVRWGYQKERELDHAVSHGNSIVGLLDTFESLLERYKKDILPKKKAGDYEAIMINAFIRNADIAQKKTLEIKPFHFAQYRDQRLKIVSGVTVARELTIYQSVFKTARREWGYENLDNPLKDIKKPNSHKPRIRRLTGDEEYRLISACNESQNPYLVHLVKIAIETAMRRSELLNLNSSDIDLEKRICFLEETKNGSNRNVPLSSIAVEHFSKLLSLSSETVFPVSSCALRGLWLRAIKRANISNLRFHDLRHEATSRLFEKGLNVMEVSSITGHRDLRMLTRYTHLKAEELARKLS